MTQQIIELGTRQWSTFMNDKWRWLGNVTLEEGQIRPFIDKNVLLMTIHVKSVFRTQQQRSY